MTASARSRAFFAAGLIVVSGVVHLLVLSLLPRVDASRAARAVDVEMVTMTLAAQPVSTRATRRAGDADHALDPQAGREVRAPRPLAGTRKERFTIAQPERAEPSAPERQPERESEVIAKEPVDLSPRGVVLSTLSVPSAVSTQDTLTRDDLATQRGAALSAELRAVANANPLRERAAPELVRDADGTCHYSGTAIDATVLPDGEVRFEDKSEDVRIVSVQPLDRGQFVPRGGVQMPPERPVTPEEMLPAQQLDFRLRFAARAWKAERAWFLRETEGLRRELADHAHERDLARAEHELRKQLDHIWCDATVPVPDRRRALFELWDAMSADEVGLRGRGVLLDYIHDNLAQGSPLAYPSEQLASLNARRTQREAFAPYGAAGH